MVIAKACRLEPCDYGVPEIARYRAAELLFAPMAQL
jgi:hypothetical protein